MSLKNIGNLLTEISIGGNTANALKSFGSLNSAANALNIFTNLGEQAKINALKNAFEGLDEDAYKAALSLSAAGNAATGATSGMAGFSAATTGVAASLKNAIIAHPAIVAITGIVSAFALLSVAVQDSQEKIDKAFESKQNHTEKVSEIESLNSELETTKSKIDEINAKDNISLTDEAELVKLQNQTRELQNQIELKEKLANEVQIQAAKDASNAIDSYSIKDATTSGTDGLAEKISGFFTGVLDKIGVANWSPKNQYDLFYEKITERTNAQTKLDQSILELEEMKNKKSTSNRDIRNKENWIKDLEKQISGLNTIIDNKYDELSEITSSYYDQKTGKVITGFEDQAKEWEKFSSEYIRSTLGDIAADNDIISKSLASAKYSYITEAAKELSSISLDNLKQQFPGLIAELEDAGVSAEHIETYFSNLADPDQLNISEIKKQLQKVFSENKYEVNLRAGERADKIWEDFTEGLSDEDLQILYSIKNENDTSTWEIEDWSKAFDEAKYGAEATANAIDTLTTKNSTLLSSFNAVNELFSSRSTGKSISLEDFNSDELKDYSSALEYNNGCLQLNADKVRALTKTKAEEQIASNEAQKSELQNQYSENTKQIEEYQKALQSVDSVMIDGKEITQSTIDQLFYSNNQIVNQCNQLDLLSSALREATSEYQGWLDAQNATESGAMFDDTLNAIQAVKDVYKLGTDDYNKTGTKKYKAAIDFIVPDSIDRKDKTAVNSYMKSIDHLLSKDSDGIVNGLNISSLISEAMKKGLMEYDGKTYKLKGEESIEQFAEGMNLSLPLVQAIFGELEEFDGDFSAWANSISDTTDKLSLLKKAVDDLNSNSAFDAIAIADETKNAGADYEKAVNYLKEAKEMYDKGLIGTDDFKARAAYFSPTGSDDPANFIENYGKAERYLTEDASGVQNFLTDLKKKGYAAFETLSDGTKQWTYDIDSLEEASQNMGMGFEFFMDMFGRLEDYGAHNNFVASVEDGATRITKLSSELVKEQAKLAEMETTGQYTTIDEDGNKQTTIANQTAIDAQREKVQALKNDILETQDAMSQLAAHSAEDYNKQVESAKQAITTLKEERDKVLKDKAYGDNTGNIVNLMDAQIRQWATDNGIELDAELNFVETPQEAIEKTNEQGVFIPVQVSADSYDSIISNAKEALESLSQHPDGNDLSSIRLNVDKDSIADVEYRIAQVKRLMLENEQGTIYLGEEGGEQLQTLLTGLLYEKLELEQPAVMSIDTSGLDGDMAYAISVIQKYQSALNELNQLQILQSAGIEVDTSAAEEKVKNFLGSVQQLPDSITKELNIDVSSAETIQNTINNLKLPNGGVSIEATDSATPVIVPVQSALDKVNQGANAVIRATDQASMVISGVSGALAGINGRVATTYIKTIKTETTQSSGTLRSPAHASGTAYNVLNTIPAYANGKVSLPQDEKALVNEMGTESLIRDGEWMLIPGGMHFENLKKGDIILNATQTADLLRTGRASGHGKAYAEGTASNIRKLVSTSLSAYGIGTGSINFGRGGSGSKSISSKSKKKTNTSNKSSSKSSSNNNSSESKDFKETIDWIEIELARLAHALDEFTNLADNYYSGYHKQNEMLNRAMEQTAKNIKANEDAYSYYIQKANSVGLSGDYQQRVRNGEINIQDITDENLKEKIDEYQKWYEKAQDCRDSIIDLNAELKKLGLQKIDNIVDDFESIVGVTDSISNNFDTANKLLEAQGKTADIGNIKGIIEQRNNAALFLRGEMKKLREEENALLANGTIVKWSQEWYELEAKVHDVSAALHENQANVYELRQQIREVQWKSFSDAIETIDGLNDNLESTLSLINDMEMFGQDSDILNLNGKLKLGLLTKQLGNARQAVADYEHAFSALNEELKNGNINQEQYAEQFKELNKGRQDAISNVKEYREAILDLIRDGINKETEAMQKLVDSRKDDLRAQKESADYARTLRDKTTEINKIKAQITALEGDDSASAKAQIRNLQNQLKEAEQDLQDTQDDHAFDVLQDGYDSAMEKFEQIQEDELYLLNSSLEEQNKAIQNMLAVARDSYQEVYDELGNLAEVYGIKLSEDLTSPWDAAQNAVKAYEEAVNKLSENIKIDTSAVPKLSTGTNDTAYGESSPSVPDNNVQTKSQQQQQQAPAIGKVSDVGATLRYGNVNEDVKKLQTALKQLGYYTDAIDGSFGNNTLNAVKQFQRASGITADGIVGKNTKNQFRIRGYASGGKTKKEIALTDEQGLGSEVIITPYGALRQLDYGSMVFNREQVEKLWDLSKTDVATKQLSNIVPSHKPNYEFINRNDGVHFDTLLTVEGNITEDVLPRVQAMITSAIDQFDKNQRKKISNDYRKMGGRIRH